MDHQQQLVSQASDASKIFVFDEVYPLRAAQEQAEKKKLGAFGMLTKLNPFNRPKEDTVQLSRQELRLEPFWHMVAKRSIDYTCQLTYPVAVNNPYAQSLQIEDKIYEVTRQKDKARIEFVAIEHCHRKIPFDRLMDGMQREIKPAVFESLINKFKYTEAEQVDRPELLKRKRSIKRALPSGGELVYRRDQVKLNRPKSDAKARVVRNHPPFLSKARL